jgi:SAM-dependent methyltransferase
MKKFFYKKEYFPKHDDNHMENEGDVALAREGFLNSRFINLDFLLHSRYNWMNPYLESGKENIEIGAGAGFSQLYLSESVTLTDAANNSWIEKYIDAVDIDYPDSSVDVIIASHTIHHFYNPAKFFKESQRVLKDNGVILISEINTSLMMRMLLKILRHEGYSYDVNVFDFDAVVNDPSDLWSANCAVPEMLFSDTEKFENFFPGLTVEINDLYECFIFPLSGGVISKKKIPKLPLIFLKTIDKLDRILIKLFPSIFALGRRVVIRKK